MAPTVNRITPPAPPAPPVPPTPGFVKKPTPTLAEIDAKKKRPPGFCAAVAEQKSRITRNKQAQDANRRVKGGKSGKGIVKDMLSSPEAFFVLAVIMAGMNALGGLVSGLAFGMFSRVGTTGTPAAEPGAGETVAETSGAERGATPSSRKRNQPKPGLGEGTEGGATAPRSASRPDVVAPVAPILSYDEQRKEDSRHRGFDVRERARLQYGDPDIFDLLHRVVMSKTSDQSSVRDEPSTWPRIAMLSPTLARYFQENGRGTIEARDLRDMLARTGAKIAGVSYAADRADAASRAYPDILARAEAWEREHPVPPAGGPLPEAGIEGGNAANPNPNAPRPGNDQDETYVPPIPGVR